MYSTLGLPYQPADRQYLVTTDDEDDIGIYDRKGYRIQELVFSIPFDDIELDSTDKELVDNEKLSLVENLSYLSKDFRKYYVSEVSAQGRNLNCSEIKLFPSKTTQTSIKGHEQGVNTSAVSTSMCTQTPDSQSSLSNDNTSVDPDELEYSLLSPDPKLIIFANKMAKVLRIKTPESTYSSDDELSNQPSIIYTYSMDKSKDSRSCYLECSKSHGSSTSCDDIRSTSGSERTRNFPEAEPSKDSDLYLYLKQECLRHCYLPYENTNQCSSVNLWEHCKVYELKKYDEIIRSHVNHSDRRLKAISNRMSCKIEVIGPYKPCPSPIISRSCTEWYKLAVYSNTRLRLEKSINCIQLSFPNSCFNEKIYKPYQNQSRF